MWSVTRGAFAACFLLVACTRANSGFVGDPGTGGGAADAAASDASAASDGAANGPAGAGDLALSTADGGGAPTDGATGDAAPDGALPDGGCVASPEVCDGVDNDCDGVVDDNVPGVGVPCGSMTKVGECAERTVCLGAKGLGCVGTFVSPSGSPSNPGTRAAPLSKISDAIRHAVLLGGGADVCACAPPQGASYTDDVVMSEGTSVLGGYACNFNFRDVVARETRILPTDPAGVRFPAGLTRATALDGVTVVGATAAPGASSAASVAVSIADASPRLVDVTAQGGQAPLSVGLAVRRIAATTVAPEIQGGAYSGVAANGGVQLAVLVDGAGPVIQGATLSNANGNLQAATSVALRCAPGGGCPKAAVTGGVLDGGGAVTLSAGLWASGDVSSLALSQLNRVSGGAAQAGGTGIGAFFDACQGKPTITNTPLRGGMSAPGTLVAFLARGAACAPAVTGGSLRGCEASGSCVAASCDEAPCTLVGATVSAGGMVSAAAVGVRCVNGGCAAITSNAIDAGTFAPGGAPFAGVGLEVQGGAPIVDSNQISAPGCGLAGQAKATLRGAVLSGTSATLTNNVLRDRLCGLDAVVLDVALKPGGAPTLHSNTLEYTTCPGFGCGRRDGLKLDAGGAALTAGMLRNTIVYNAGAGGASAAISVTSRDVTLAAIENNDLYDPNGVLYTDGTNSLSSIAALEAAHPGAKQNISAPPLFDPLRPYVLTPSSACVNAGTAAGAPDHDRQGTRRPQQGQYDIGADEYR